MNICVVLCGLTRSIDIIIDNIKNIFLNNNVDIYLSISEYNEKEYYNINNNRINNNLIKKNYI